MSGPNYRGYVDEYDYAECPICLEPIDYCPGHSNACPWCIDENADDDVDTDLLCRPHLAEYEGLSLVEMDRREQEEWMDLQ